MQGIQASGIPLNTAPELFGTLYKSDPLSESDNTLLARLSKDGYLYLPGLLDRKAVLRTRKSVLSDIAQSHPEPFTPGADVNPKFRKSIANGSAALRELTDAPELFAILNRLLGGNCRRLDFIGLRIAPHKGRTYPHCDRVYFTRGTPSLLTAWIPLGDVPTSHGGLVVMEGSNNHARLRSTYCTRDVDNYCINRPDSEYYRNNAKRWTGALTPDLNRLQRSVGGRWLTTDYSAGDVLIFTAFTLHASLDNQLAELRLSCDPRYQNANEPIDHRYIGNPPMGNSLEAKRGIVC